jgi:dephospho-CoA kinase
MSYVIGITGGVGSGKSTVLDILKSKFNAEIIEADKVGHIIMSKSMPAYYRIIEEFGESVLDDEGNVDRNALGKIVFGNEMKLKKLNSIIHPAVKEYIINFIQKCKTDKVDYIIVEAALLIEAGYRDICDTFWYVYASRDVRIERLMSSRNYTKEKCISIMDNQLSDDEFANNCDITINNSGNLSSLEEEISRALNFR